MWYGRGMGILPMCGAGILPACCAVAWWHGRLAHVWRGHLARALRGGMVPWASRLHSAWPRWPRHELRCAVAWPATGGHGHFPGAIVIMRRTRPLEG